MQAVAQLIDQLTTQLSSSTLPPRSGLGSAVIDPMTGGGACLSRWSESPLCGSGDDVDEDEAYFLGDEDEDDDDIYDDDEDDEFEDEEDDLDADVDLDEEDF